MRILVDIPEFLVERARKLIARGTYRDLSSFVTASIETQLTLEDTAINVEPVAMMHDPAEAEIGGASLRPLAEDLSIPQAELPIIAYPSRPGLSAEQQWPWGQINKLLPIKFAVRLLSNSVSNAEPLVPFDLFRTQAAEKARLFGRWLERNDEKYERKWGTRLSAGFPIGEREASSLNRYAIHFVGHQRKGDGALFGGLFVLKLANAEVVGTKLSAGLTEAGVEFARIPNPVLDNTDLSSSLGEEEISFYLDHVRDRVPGERYAYDLILTLIAQGVDGRQELNQEIKKEVGLDWTDSVVNTQRAGAMARMQNLGLVESTRDGVRVRYLATDRGLRFTAVEGVKT